MRSSRVFIAITATTAFLYAASAAAASSIDMDDPRRALGREGDVRIDAQIIQDTVSPGSPIGVTYQIENLSAAPVAVADKVASASYDSDSQTITLAIGSEVPRDGRMPHVVTIEPGQKKVFRAGATPSMNSAVIRTGASAPRFVQVKVTILRDLAPFAALVASQSAQGGGVLTDDQFEKWFESNDTIFLNSVPVRYSPKRVTTRGYAAADHRDPGGDSF